MEQANAVLVNLAIAGYFALELAVIFYVIVLGIKTVLAGRLSAVS